MFFGEPDTTSYEERATCLAYLQMCAVCGREMYLFGLQHGVYLVSVR
jgi:hypothetical protein